MSRRSAGHPAIFFVPAGTRLYYEGRLSAFGTTPKACVASVSRWKKLGMWRHQARVEFWHDWPEGPRRCYINWRECKLHRGS